MIAQTHLERHQLQALVLAEFQSSRILENKLSITTSGALVELVLFTLFQFRHEDGLREQKRFERYDEGVITRLSSTGRGVP